MSDVRGVVDWKLHQIRAKFDFLKAIY